MVNILGDCFKESSQPVTLNFNSPSQNQIYMPTKLQIPGQSYQENLCIQDDLPDFASFKYMTLAEAEKQHRWIDKNNKCIGDLKTAYKCFEAYAKFNQIRAKYYKAYYISKGYVNLNDVGIDIKEKDKIVAELFKEVADNDDANEFPGAKLRYGDCLYHGKGVKLNLSEALKYFEKAAEDGLKVAMYNVGNLYYRGCDGVKDEQKAIHYMKLAVIENTLLQSNFVKNIRLYYNFFILIFILIIL